jgi:hypothetical protein
MLSRSLSIYIFLHACTPPVIFIVLPIHRGGGAIRCVCGTARVRLCSTALRWHSRGTARPGCMCSSARDLRAAWCTFAFGAIGRSRALATGATWRLVSASAPWAARYGHTSVIDAVSGAIYVLGGTGGGTYYDDVWVSTDGGARAGLGRGTRGGGVVTWRERAGGKQAGGRVVGTDAVLRGTIGAPQGTVGVLKGTIGVLKGTPGVPSVYCTQAPSRDTRVLERYLRVRSG